MYPEFNNLILKQASRIIHVVSDIAPSEQRDVFNQGTLKIWTGASEWTIWNDPTVNWAFRAIHDALHIKTGLGFTPDAEIELGRIQANQYSGLLADIVYLEVAGQAEYFKRTGLFLENQRQWILERLKGV